MERKIILARIGWGGLKDDEPQPPLGIGYIAAFLREKGIHADIYDSILTQEHLSVEEIVKDLKEADIVGFTTYFNNIKDVHEISKHIKEENPNTVIVVGGPQVTFTAENTLKNNAIDYVVRKEGEQTFYELVIALDKGRDVSEINGLSFRKDNKIINTKDREFIDLNRIPSPYLTEVFDISKYKTGSIMTARGCPYRCTYCVCGAFCGHQIREHPIDVVAEEVKYLSDNKIKDVFMSDDTFTFNERRTMELIDRITEESYDCVFWIETRANHMNEELAHALSYMGVCEVAFGLESATPKVLKKIRKGITAQMVKKAVQHVHDAEMNTSISIIIGLPLETIETAKKTIDFLDQLLIKEDERAYINFLHPFEGTEIYEKREELGINILEEPYKGIIDGVPVEITSITNLMSIDDIKEVASYAFKVLGERTHFALIKRKMKSSA